MKTVKVVAMSLAIGAFIGCGGGHQDGEHHSDVEHHELYQDSTHHHQEPHAKYQCPMDCENGKIYEEPGKCPVCEMDMVEVGAE